MQETVTIERLWRYPVKGLSPERMSTAMLSPGDPIPGDRRYAIENGPSGFDPAAPKHLAKMHFLMLMRNERLATLRTRFDDATTTLEIGTGRETIRGDLSTAEGRARIEAFFGSFMPAELRGAPKVLEAPGFSFSDVARRVVSIINASSVTALEQRIGLPVDPLRFRGNLHVSGLPPWGEFDLVGKHLAAEGGPRLRVVKRIVRCAATDVDPVTGFRDMRIPRVLDEAYGHSDFGVYAEVVEGGELREGSTLRVVA
jgi:uncharacterized protein YcbX